MARNTKVQQFRDTATEEKWTELVIDATATVPVGKSIQEKYGFSWNSIMKDAADRGYYQMRRKTTYSENSKSDDSRIFMVDDLPEETEVVISRSVQLDKSVYDRLKALETAKRQYTHKAILNQLLSDVLKIYGY
ncbi:MAG TPA: hypothetical protein GX723_06795 [Thermoanaerobacterales bacterium]|nr:hypothetical protein [Thermoanaerobacterales bacterium]